MTSLRFVLTLATVTAVAGVLVASSAGGPPPPVIAHVGVTHARPVAGHTFTGFIVTPGASYIDSVNCDAELHGKTLRGHVRRFYDSAGGPVVAFACGWNVPAKARGMLSSSVVVESIDGTLTSPVQRWRIKRSR